MRREFMARSQLPDVLRHNNKPPPDEVEKHLELPPGTLSCQLANYLLHPAVSGQRSGVTTSNAPQNSDSLNLPWPQAHGVGGCCYHLHKPPPPPRAFSVKAKLQQLKQRFSGKALSGPAACAAAQAPACATGGIVQSPRQRWIPPPAQPPLQRPAGNKIFSPPVRLNGAPLLMQHGGQAGGSVPMPPVGVQKQPTQQLLPYTIDRGAATPQPRPPPIVLNSSGPSGSPREHQGATPVLEASPNLTRSAANKSTADRQPFPSSQWEPYSGTREKSKSITEREVGPVLPALVWSGEEAVSSENLTLPEPKTPLYPPRSKETGGRVPSVFPPYTSWIPVEPPPTAPLIPFSVMQAAMGANSKALAPKSNAGLQSQGRQLTSQILSPPVNSQTMPIKAQQQLMQDQLLQQQHMLNQQVRHHYDEAYQNQRPIQAAPTSEELSGIHLKAPENALGVFEGQAGSSVVHDQAEGNLSTKYLLSARGSRTLPGDAGSNAATYQINDNLGPWQFAGLL